MTNFNYSDDIPFATNDPSVDQPNMQENTNSIDHLIDVDHISFNQENGGFHKILHQITGPVGAPRTRSGVGATFANFPIGIPGINQLFTALYTPDAAGAVADTQLFNKTGNGGLNGGISQLTGDNAATEGYQWIGGVLLQWGFIAITGSTTTVLFKDASRPNCPPFPNNCFNVQLTAHNTSTTSNTNLFEAQTLTPASFKLKTLNYVVGSDFYWFAIGN